MTQKLIKVFMQYTYVQTIVSMTVLFLNYLYNTCKKYLLMRVPTFNRFFVLRIKCIKFRQIQKVSWSCWVCYAIYLLNFE